jgi:hypothetical protein
MTSDVDAFVMSPGLLSPLRLTGMKAWIFQYSHSADRSGDEASFPMCFIAMRYFFLRGPATPCASLPPQPSIFSDYSFLVHHPVNRYD